MRDEGLGIRLKDPETGRYQTPVSSSRAQPRDLSWETLIKSLSDFILGFLYRARRQGARIASYLRRMSTTLCIKIHMKSDSVI